MAERVLGKDEVTSSILVIGSSLRATRLREHRRCKVVRADASSDNRPSIKTDAAIAREGGTDEDR
jgi:hypothetical protein